MRAYRVGQLAPWNVDTGINWDKLVKPNPDAAVDAAIRKIENERDQGKGFRTRIQGKDWSKILQKSEIDDALLLRVRNLTLGPPAVMLSVKSGFRWFIREIEVDPVAKTPGNNWIDKVFDFVFEELSAQKPENWGICVKKEIAGSDTLSQHNPWEDMNDAGGAGANAIDIGCPVRSRGDAIFDAVRRAPRAEVPCGKMLWQRRAWTPERGVYDAPSLGSSHLTHIHAQGLHERPSNWSLVQGSCP